MKEDVKAAIQWITEIVKEGGTGWYLGSPECFSGSKMEMMAYIYDRLKSRLSGWFMKQLSLGGKRSIDQSGRHGYACVRYVML